jgi:predicted dithiol-disulfide oxidoreductase (DUF899 family)
MTTHRIATREEWLKERLDLLAAEKAHTNASDDLAERRQALPWVKIDRTIASTPIKARRRSPISSAAARS